jgi:hypothetical protein
MLCELSGTEQRYRAVLEVSAGVPGLRGGTAGTPIAAIRLIEAADRAKLSSFCGKQLSLQQQARCPSCPAGEPMVIL